ncbi:delta-6 fatty acid desaturase [Hesseltinella vesiculosa]|uniref:Delta-6 fatty acid desaturase n=1 Tax=Hesseltinella vesiculosa TaxID=101127 RepID=A0A1X2GQ23_9FUNG|nr:delta-6 fatty acid desaturase [Hesseltinella vesiculosa]
MDSDKPSLIYIQNKIYDVSEFVNEHPGGAKVLLTHVGKDASDVFQAMHPDSAFELLANYYVGDTDTKYIPGGRHQKLEFEHDMRQLRRELEQSGKFIASPWYYLFKFISTLLIGGLSCILLYTFGQISSVAVVMASCLMGLFWQQCGWLAHDFGHHQVFSHRFWNDVVLVFLGDFCQGFALSWWKNKHNTHHASTNVSGDDPDIDTAPVLLWDEYTTAYYYGTLQDEQAIQNKDLTHWLARYILPYQTRYYFFVIGLARASWAIQSLLYIIQVGAVNRSKSLRAYEAACLISHWLLFATMTYFWIGDLTHRLMFFTLSQAVAGYLLSIVFALNHNGMPVISKSVAKDLGFFEIQAITSRNIKLGVVGGWMTGGLNYQIEHHLFPMLPRHHLGTIQPRVEALCKKHHVNYHVTDFYHGTLEVLHTLHLAETVSQRMVKKTWTMPE